MYYKFSTFVFMVSVSDLVKYDLSRPAYRQKVKICCLVIMTVLLYFLLFIAIQEYT
jgi:hypothetical protein